MKKAPLFLIFTQLLTISLFSCSNKEISSSFELTSTKTSDRHDLSCYANID